MKSILPSLLSSLALPLLLAASLPAQASQLTTLLGQPDPVAPFVSGLIEETLPLTPGTLEMEDSTAVYSVLAREGVRRTTNVAIIPENSSCGYRELLDAIRLAQGHAPVVLDPLGPNTDWLCAEMAKHADTLYVMPAGAEASDVPAMHARACLSSNLVYVAALADSGAEGTPGGPDAGEELASFSNFGEWVTIAAPGVNIPVTLPGGRAAVRSGTSWAAALVAARLAIFAGTRPELRGEKLAQAFFARETHPVHGLEGKIQAARALDRHPRGIALAR